MQALERSRLDSNSWRFAAGGLVLAAVVVAVAITLGGGAARTLNGLGAIFWVGSGVLLALSLPMPERRVAGWLAAIVCGVALGALVRPGSLPEAVVGFAIAGVVIVVAAGDRVGAWALLAPAIYLPVHLIIGVGGAIMRGGGGVRTDPPPTAALVPLVMILAAAVAGSLTATMLRRSR